MAKRRAKFSCGTISQIRSAFKNLLKPCGRKKELPYNFTFDDQLKRTVVNDSFYVRIGDSFTRNQEGLCLEVSTSVEVCLYYQCGKLEVDTQERALIEGEGFLAHVLDPSNRPACFSHIVFNRMFMQPCEGNEYIVKICLDFDVRQTLRIDAEI